MPVTDIQHEHRGHCSCCGTDTVATRGKLVNGSRQIAAYLVKWTVDQPSHGMIWLVSFRSERNEDLVVCLRYFFEEGSFMVRGLGDETWTPEELEGYSRLLDRDEVIGTPLAERVFAMVDEIWLTDPHVLEFVAAATAEVDEPYEYFGGYSNVDARRLLEALEDAGIDFIVGGGDEGAEGLEDGGGLHSADEVVVCVHVNDLERAEEIRCRVLRFEV
jgi:hypothetical protein